MRDTLGIEARDDPYAQPSEGVGVPAEEGAAAGEAAGGARHARTAVMSMLLTGVDELADVLQPLLALHYAQKV